MEFRVLDRGTRIPSEGKDTVYLEIDHWNDYSFITMFSMSLHDEDGNSHRIGQIRIGFKGQTTHTATFHKLPGRFESLGDEFFSLGNDVDFYENIAKLRNYDQVLTALRDIALQPDLIEGIKDEDVFGTSLLRSVSLSVIKGQYARVLQSQPKLTDFKFKFFRPEADDFGGIELSFDVEVASKPTTNIHSVIGRNGVGKTTLLNGMIEAITDRQGAKAKFFEINQWEEDKEISSDYFSSLVSVSFSAFDPFVPPQEQSDPAKGTCYFYIGLKDQKKGELHHRAIDDLQDDCTKALITCFFDEKKKKRWLNAIEKLSSDEIFASMQLEKLNSIYSELCEKNKEEQSDSKSFQSKYRKEITPFLSHMSSGHAIVLLTITSLVAAVEEKTLVLLDEPESHLHPPLLSAFVRALADLLIDQNGVAIIATHSPVVLQEIPRSCVWKIYRRGADVKSDRPTIETFGENVGILTSEVFSLEVERSGFYDLLAKSVETGKNYKKIIEEYDNKIGFEGRAILKALIANRDRSNSHDANQ